MVCIVYHEPKTNIQNDKELFEYLQEINERVENELFIEHHLKFDKKLFGGTRKIEWYKIYWNVETGFQEIMSFELLDRKNIICYLLGVLTGLDEKK